VNDVRKVASGVPFEKIVGYSRAVAAGDYIFVSGSTSVVDGQVVHQGDVRAQTGQAIANIGLALAKLGADLTDVVRTRMFVTDITRWEETGEAHQAAFGGAAPATSMVQVAALIDPAMLVEVEAVAYKPGIGGSGGSGAGAGLGWPA
jgi:enamine deaminase RidA (YjgF/YER057c/UK114 family)